MKNGFFRKRTSKHEVRVDRSAVFEAEGDDAHLHRRRAVTCGPELRDDRSTELVDAEAGRVDDPRGARAKRRETLTLDLHAIQNAARAVTSHRQRMWDGVFR